MNKRGNDEEKLENIMLNTIAKYHLIATNDTIVVGVSGGPDSICLLDALNKIIKFFQKCPQKNPEPVGSGENVPKKTRNQWGHGENSCGSCESYVKRRGR